MGVHGPIPKPAAQRRRSLGTSDDTTKGRGAERVTVPRADGSWHPTAKRWYRSLARSGQSEHYEPSDWATAWLIAEAISRELEPQPVVVGRGREARVEMVTVPPKAAAMTAWLRAMTSLLVTEGDRRRARLELQRPVPVAEDVPTLDDYRRRVR